MTFRRHSMARVLAVTALAGLAFSAPGVVEAAKKKKPAAAQTVQAISAKDKQTGAQAHPELLAEFGGAMTGAQALYVENVGKNIAVQSGLSNARSDFTVTLLNSSVNNAFAIPGGYVYVTRQLAALMNNEAELAGVLGHEVGHVAARHAQRRQKAATQNSIIGVLGTIASAVLLGDSAFGELGQRIFSQGSQLLTLRFSRTQEIEADNLGIAYLRKAGYDPRAMSTVLQSLANQNALEAQLMGRSTRVPEWASTHPDPASRVRTALATAGANATGATNRDAFLRGIDGLMYGDDPKQGVIDNGRFTHPDFRLTFQAPQGFYLVNGTRSVSIGGQTGKGEFTNASYSGDLDAYVRAAFTALGQANQQQLAPQTLERTTVNGLPAAYGMARVNGQNGPVDVVVFAYEFSKTQAYHFLTITQAGQSGTFNPMFQSMSRISAADAAKVRPRKVVVVTTKTGDTLQSLADRMAYSDAPMQRFLVLNGLTASSRIVAGQKVKLVTF